MFFPSWMPWILVRKCIRLGPESHCLNYVRPANVAMCSHWGISEERQHNLNHGQGEVRVYPWILTLEYEKDYPYAGLIEDDKPSFLFTGYSSLSIDLGEHSHINQSPNSHQSPSLHEPTGITRSQTYQNRLVQFIEEFLETSTGTCFSRDKISAIVIGEEASSKAVMELADIARKVVGNGIVKIHTDSTYPSAMTVHGSAAWAHELGQAYLSSPCGFSRFLTSEQYEHEMKVMSVGAPVRSREASGLYS